MVKASSLLLLLVSQSGLVGADFQAHDINADLQLAHLSLDADITYFVSDNYFSVDSNGVISSNKRLDADSNNGYYDFLVTMTVPVRIYTKNTNNVTCYNTFKPVPNDHERGQDSHQAQR